MSIIPINRNEYDHPEHFDDLIREFKSSDRYIPTPLEQYLFELSGHACTICKAPWLEIHHIKSLNEGGRTEYENLIVLCPNCHTRVHSTGTPSETELKQYKLKQEISYELPIIGKLSRDEIILIKELSILSTEEMIIYSKHKDQYIKPTEVDAIKSARKNVGLLYLQECGIISIIQTGICMILQDGIVVVPLELRLNSKGIKWISYLKETDNFLLSL